MNEVCGDGGDYFPLPPDEADCASVLRSIANGGGEAQCSPGLGSPGEGSGSGRQNVEGNNSEGGVFSSSSDDEEGSSADTKKGLNLKRKRRTREKIEHFVERLVMEVMDKQEQMHAQLIEMLERRERERIMREEDWRKQEMERNKREAAAREEETSRNLALISFIHKALGGGDGDIKISEQLAAISPDQAKDVIFATPCEDKGRWSEAEINALITLRTPIEPKFRIVGPKCSYLWDGISAGMKKMGFNRSGKKCSEKWENMNHYYKRSMENRGKKGFNSNKVPYFHELKLLHEKEGFNSYITANQTTRDASADDVIENQLGS
ncbi:unnamed protein product [Linum tenue]|uniref:Myb-like domain-containing protein n=1 Tax=Linum tenue TaxID=586396 RepID=A0AAV0M1J3_9ROSI|nr:unnamed protein product [Linum tenue]